MTFHGPTLCRGSRTEASRSRAPIDAEDSMLMQVGGHKLTTGERLARPHRPVEWTEALRKLTQLPPHIATRSRAILRKWLSEKAQQTGYTLAAVGMMLRDVLMDCTLRPLEAAAEKKAAEAAAEIPPALQHYLNIRHTQGGGARQSALVHEALLLAIRMDETDIDLMPVTDDYQARLDNEEVHLMYHANNQVRRWLQAQPSERTRRLTLLTRAVQEQLGSEARHLRRMGVVLQGLQMIGTGHDQWHRDVAR